MAKVRYVGIHDKVELELPSGARVCVQQGEAVETTASQAGLLVTTTSDMWEYVKPAAGKSTERADSSAKE